MPKEKAALFIDNSNIFIGMIQYADSLRKFGKLNDNEFIRINWEKLVNFLENQDEGLDIFARHFFASIPAASEVGRLRRRPTDEEWDDLVRNSLQNPFFKTIQNP